MQKMKNYDLKGIQFHNQRERESRTNSDIDPAKTKLNYDLVNPVHIDYKEKVKSIIEEQKTSERKVRKDAVLVNELLITSDQEFFESLSLEEQKRFFKESFELFSERYGRQNIAYAMVHLDEKTPHFHLGVVPMRDGKLQGKNVFNRQELLWIQNEFPKQMQQLGFDLQRGEENSSREHLTVQRFKAETIKEQIQELEENKTELEEDLNTTVNRLEALKGSLEALETHSKDIDAIVGKKSFMRQDVLLKVDDFESLRNYAKKLPAVMLDNTKLSQERNRFEEKNELLKKQVLKLGKENDSLIKENKNLKKELSISQQLYKFAKEFLKRNKIFEKFVQYLQNIDSKEKEVRKNEQQQQTKKRNEIENER